MEQVTLSVEDQTFKINKNVLCEQSDYFRAMFSGNYVENEQQEVKIDVVDAASMKLIIQYMGMGLIDLFEHSLSTIGDLAMAANFLQITKLIKQIEFTLELQISLSNWIDIMAIAQNASYFKLEQSCAAFGLLSFRNMKLEYIPSIHKLFWYLSHSYLDAGNELDVFKFGLKWISSSETGADALLIILGCLDLNRLTANELTEIKKLIVHYDISLAAKVIDCLSEIFLGNIELSCPAILEKKTLLCEKFTERVYNEVLNLIKESRHRILSYVPIVPIFKTHLSPHFLYTFSAKSGFEQWLEVANKSFWGWRMATWGPMRLIVMGGECEIRTGSFNFMTNVKVYDTLKKEWVQHRVNLPSRTQGGVAVLDDLLFIIGGVELRIIGAKGPLGQKTFLENATETGVKLLWSKKVLDSALIYDLKHRTIRNIANFPDAMQDPAICVHDGKVYASGHNNIYRYEDLGDTDQWVRVASTECGSARVKMVSYNGYIYCTQNCFRNLYRFKPDVDPTLTLITSFTNPPAAICNLGDRLLFFTQAICGQSATLAAEEFTGRSPDEKPKVIWSQSESHMKVNDVAGSGSLVMNMPPVHQEISQYHQKYLSRYVD